MSLCKHNIIANSTFSRCAAVINLNPDRKVFLPFPSDTEAVQKYLCSLETKEISPLDNRFINIPYDYDNRPDIEIRPWFSLLMAVNNDIATLEKSLESILAQDYKYHEVIIIDNASFDGSGKLCKQAAKISDKVTLIKLWEHVSNGAAWNKALSLAQGKFVMFLKGNDKLFPDALTSLYIQAHFLGDVAGASTWFREDDSGTISVDDKNFSIEMLTDNEQTAPLATKIFNRKFLTDNAICFDEQAADAELKFTTEAMRRINDEMLILSEPFYVAPKI